MFSKGILSRVLKTFRLCGRLEFVPFDEILDLPKLEGFSDDKIKVAQKLKFGWGRLKSIFPQVVLPLVFYPLLCNADFKPFPKQQVLDLSKLKAFADNNYNFVENGRNLFKQVEKHCGKRRNSRYAQFLLFLQCFWNTCTADT